jgi:antitoxin component YwqK of YwqJK toxin-antitoxin module
MRRSYARLARQRALVSEYCVVRAVYRFVILTAVGACGSGSVGPQPAPPQPKTQQLAAPPSPRDAGPPDTPPPPKLACDGGATLERAPIPDPTWFCAKNGARDGAFITLFPDGTVQIRGGYRSGKLDGPWERRHPNGAIAEQGNYVGDVKDGHWRQTSPIGALLGEYDLTNGSGVEKRWLDDGTLYSERALKSGVPNGAFKIYAPDGSVVVSARFAAGKLDGDHAVGTRATLRIDETFAAGVRRGRRQIWQFWLLAMDEGYDRRGRLDGAFTIWRSAKVPRVQGTYENGHRTGSWAWFDRGNNKEREGSYVYGKKDGPWTEWYENKITFTGSYVQGKPDGEFVHYDRAGNELGKFEIKDGTGWMLTFHPNRTVATRTHMFKGELEGGFEEMSPRKKKLVEGAYTSGRKHGTWREWNESGELLREERWKRGKLEGVVKKFTAGQLVSEIAYKDGKAEGKYTEYTNGKPTLVGEFADDKKTGTWTEYDVDGAAVLVATYKDGVLDGPWRELVGGVAVAGTMTAGHRTGTWTRTDKAGATTSRDYPSTP